jgi:transposase
MRPQLNAAERGVMERLLASESLSARQAARLQVVLGRADGKSTSEIAEVLRIHPVSVSDIVHRFNAHGVDGLLKQPNHKPGKAPIGQKVINRVLKLVQTHRPEEATHWSTRRIAQRVGISHTKVHQILQAHNLKPHLVEHFQVSHDPAFERKLEDIVGLYLNPPDNAIVLCIDEKSQVQALERAQPILPLRPGLPERQTHDYLRHGVTNLYAALDVASGQVIGSCADRHRAQEYPRNPPPGFIDFLRLVNRNTPKGKVLHLIVDNASSHDTQSVREYLANRPKRFVVHFTPTHASWLNLVERWFAEITTQRIRRGSWSSVNELERAILDYIHHWNESGRRFVWTKSSKDILRRVRKATRD